MVATMTDPSALEPSCFSSASSSQRPVPASSSGPPVLDTACHGTPRGNPAGALARALRPIKQQSTPGQRPEHLQVAGLSPHHCPALQALCVAQALEVAGPRALADLRIGHEVLRIVRQSLVSNS